jgi:DNA-binding response OmpR family regulator
MRILVIDDDQLLAGFIRETLQEDGYAVDVARDGREGRKLAKIYEYDGIILDYVLPDRSGIEILEELRAAGHAVPVLMLTSRGSEDDVVRGLDAGADDYLRKPFRIAELRARLRALIRRGGASRTEQVNFGDLLLDRLKRRVLKDGREIRLTPKEYALLEYFILNPERVVTRTHLLEKVWDLHFDPGSNVIDANIARIRAKLKQSGTTVQLDTVRGAGFLLRSSDA